MLEFHGYTTFDQSFGVISMQAEMTTWNHEVNRTMGIIQGSSK